MKQIADFLLHFCIDYFFTSRIECWKFSQSNQNWGPKCFVRNMWYSSEHRLQKSIFLLIEANFDTLHKWRKKYQTIKYAYFSTWCFIRVNTWLNWWRSCVVFSFCVKSTLFVSAIARGGPKGWKMVSRTSLNLYCAYYAWSLYSARYV